MFFVILKREYSLLKNNILNPVIFFIIAIAILIFTTKENNSEFFPIIWISAFYAITINMSNSFLEDFRDGSFEQILLSDRIFELIIFYKITSNFIINSLPIIFIIPILLFISQFGEISFFKLFSISFLVILAINFLTALSACLSLSSNLNNAILPIITLPLIFPIIILSHYCIINPNMGNVIEILVAITIFIIITTAYFSAFVIKTNIKY